jgi:hypothetical protein
MMTVSDPAVDTALAEYKRVKALVREAKVKYPALLRELQSLPVENLACTAENIRLLNERKKLLAQMDVYGGAYHNGVELLRSATHHLRFTNGVSTECYVDRRIGALVMLRLEQGYGSADVALMIGCTASTVSSIKVGRYRYSDKPENANVGGRARKNRLQKAFDRAIEATI